MKSEDPNSSRPVEQLERLARHLEALNIADYLESLERPRKLIVTNFIAGISRGLGFAIGTTIVFALVIEILRRIILLHLPFISASLIDFLQLVDLKK